ncbi:MAG: sulfite exporter TauE/SafE family protein [Clostridia bacterium]|nr:sulfite exporter TauE/SafE family protein [Clostridia bacterium]
MWDNPWLILLGAGVGVLSGMGVGGGSLLIVLLSVFGQVEQAAAQGVNLVYFLPGACIAIFIHWRKGSIDLPAAVTATVSGLATALGGALLATHLETALLKKLFAGLLLFAGVTELFGGKGEKQKERKGDGDARV